MFWENDPSTDTPISSDNLSRMEKHTVATAGSDGDYYVTIPGTVANGDIIHIRFPDATDNTKQLRISVDGGSNYYDVHFNTSTALLASAVEGKRISFTYRSVGTYWAPMDAIRSTDATWTFIFYPDGHSECSANVSKGSVHTWTADGAIYMSDELTYSFPTGLFASADPRGSITPETGSGAALCWGVQRTLTNTSTVIALARTASGAVFFPIALRYVGSW